MTDSGEQTAAFLRLPFELREKIYHYLFWASTFPEPQDIYTSENPVNTKQRPISLYFVNRQIRIGMRDLLLEKSNAHLLVTHEGSFFTSFYETAILAGNFRDVAHASRLAILVWPPHPDRPADIVKIWRHLRVIQRQLLDKLPLKIFLPVFRR